MKIVYTKHALGKFKHRSIVRLGIKRKHIKQALINPNYSGETEEKEILFVLVKLDDKHDLRVIYRKSDIIKIITFHPAERGRYEN